MTRQELEKEREAVLSELNRELEGLCSNGLMRSISIYNELKRAYIGSVRVSETMRTLKDLLENETTTKAGILNYLKEQRIGLNDEVFISHMIDDLYQADEVFNITAHYLPQLDRLNTFIRLANK